jgi:quercetin dioxygenase-like cupin family protein
VLPSFARAAGGAITVTNVISLEEGAVASWPVLSGKHIFEVIDGTLWFTCEKRREDFLVTAGERLVIEAPGKVVGQSLVGTATVRVLTL